MSAEFHIKTKARYSAVHSTLERDGEPLVFNNIEALYAALLVLESADVEPVAVAVLPLPPAIGEV